MDDPQIIPAISGIRIDGTPRLYGNHATLGDGTGTVAGDERNSWRMMGNYLSLGMMLPLCTLIGYAIGYFLDKLFQTRFLYLVFLLFGIAAGFIELIRQLSKDSTGRGD
ncbi:MAG: AtpZ/AtpI family protein [Bryobacterales bacterium]|nr:AtpZ/AtpI family protein [Bryobacterales bacterium]